MLNNKTISIVIPAFNEEERIINVLNSIPGFVDKVIIINDGSKDNTKQLIESYIENHNKSLEKVNFNASNFENFIKERNSKWVNIYSKNSTSGRFILINHEKNLKKGAAIISGYMLSKHLMMDCIVTIDGDGQMNTNEIELLCNPILNKEVDYVKGDRFKHSEVWNRMPKIRIFGNIILSFLTRIASGYYKLSDTQTGFNAISLYSLKKLNLNKIYTDFGYPNDLLNSLNIENIKIKQLKIEPIYFYDRISKMNLLSVTPKILLLLVKLFFVRFYKKYLSKKIFPISLYFLLSFLILPILCVYSVVYISNFKAPLLICLSWIISFSLMVKEDKRLNKNLEIE